MSYIVEFLLSISKNAETISYWGFFKPQKNE